MKYRLPIFVDLSGRRVLVVGGGQGAARKLPRLLETGAEVTVIAPRISREVRRLLAGTPGLLIERAATVADVTAEYTLLFPLTDNPLLNRQLTAAARRARVLVSGCSAPANSDFLMGSVVDRRAVRVAVSTGGASRPLARQIAAILDELQTKHAMAPLQPRRPSA